VAWHLFQVYFIWFLISRCQWVIYMTLNVMLINGWWIGKVVEGRCSGIVGCFVPEFALRIAEYHQEGQEPVSGADISYVFFPSYWCFRTPSDIFSVCTGSFALNFTIQCCEVILGNDVPNLMCAVPACVYKHISSWAWEPLFQVWSQ